MKRRASLNTIEEEEEDEETFRLVISFYNLTNKQNEKGKTLSPRRDLN